MLHQNKGGTRVYNTQMNMTPESRYINSFVNYCPLGGRGSLLSEFYVILLMIGLKTIEM